MNLLSVIIPMYNGEKNIKDTIEYIQASEYKYLEILIVNDGSTDSSLDIVTNMQCKDSRIVIYNKNNGGVASAREYGVTKAKGDFICFVDQDDIVKPFTYSKLIYSMNKYGSDMAMCSSGRSINGKVSGYDIQEDAVYIDDAIRTQLLFPILFNGCRIPLDNVGNGNHYPHIWNCMFRAKFWRDNGIKFRAYVNFEDDLLVKIEALSKAVKVNTISDIGYLWRINTKSQTYVHMFIANIGQKQDLAYQDILNSLVNACIDKNILKFYKQIMYCKQYVDAVDNLSHLKNKNRGVILKYFNENIYNRDFENTIIGRKYIKKSFLKASILLPILAHKKSMACYYAEKLVDMFIKISLHFHILVKIERKTKGMEF